MYYSSLLLLAGLVGLSAAATLSPTLVVTTAAADEDCDDDPTGDCWTRPDGDCFGIYEPWSRVHCPLRCGFCPGGKMPPCEDKLPYCDRFEANTCTADNYKIWARNNCRKHCNLCAVPTRPPGMSTMTTPVPVTPEGTTAGGSTMVPEGTTMGGSTTYLKPTGGPHDIPGTVARGEQSTILIKAPGNHTDGMCLYHDSEYKEGERWYDGCRYTCACMNSAQNLVVCTERCERWTLDAALTTCKLVPEENECCPRLECN